jgi:hypothetical protein
MINCVFSQPRSFSSKTKKHQACGAKFSLSHKHSYTLSPCLLDFLPERGERKQKWASPCTQWVTRWLQRGRSIVFSFIHYSKWLEYQTCRVIGPQLSHHCAMRAGNKACFYAEPTLPVMAQIDHTDIRASQSSFCLLKVTMIIWPAKIAVPREDCPVYWPLARPWAANSQLEL